MNELRLACEVWSTEVCEVSVTKNLRGKPVSWNERLHGVGAQVIMELVHMHEGLVRFPAVAGIVESGPLTF